MASDVDAAALCPFEGPEKLLEVWFAPSCDHVPDTDAGGSPLPMNKRGLRAVERKVWEDMLDIVKCKVLSVVNGVEMDAYLLSESSLFVSSHRLILKTCGTTLNLLGLPRILSIAKEHAGFPDVYRLFYSRKAFMFPEKQLGPHRDWALEIEYLDRFFDTGAAYTVGKVNGDHWLLYMTAPADVSYTSGSNSGTERAESESLSNSVADIRLLNREKIKAKAEAWAIVGGGGLYTIPVHMPPQDYTIEILMTHLSARARAAFYTPDIVDPTGEGGPSPTEHAQQLSRSLGISDIFPRKRTALDAYAFSPCGYSANALIEWEDGTDGTELATDKGPDDDEGDGEGKAKGEGYYTIHVTPEDGWSYASFECNVPLAARSPHSRPSADAIPDLRTLIQRVVRIFEPGKITLTLFVAADSSSADDLEGGDGAEDEAAADAAQKAFKAALARVPSSFPSKEGCGADKVSEQEGRTFAYKRTDKINYEFGGYDLAFASFELIGRSP